MELEKVESDLLALRQLYGLLQNIGQGLQSKSSENLDEKAQLFLKTLLDNTTERVFETHSKIIAAQSGVSNTPKAMLKLNPPVPTSVPIITQASSKGSNFQSVTSQKDELPPRKPTPKKATSMLSKPSISSNKPEGRRQQCWIYEQSSMKRQNSVEDTNSIANARATSSNLNSTRQHQLHNQLGPSNVANVQAKEIPQVKENPTQKRMHELQHSPSIASSSSYLATGLIEPGLGNKKQDQASDFSKDVASTIKQVESHISALKPCSGIVDSNTTSASLGVMSKPVTPLTHTRDGFVKKSELGYLGEPVALGLGQNELPSQQASQLSRKHDSRLSPARKPIYSLSQPASQIGGVGDGELFSRARGWPSVRSRIGSLSRAVSQNDDLMSQSGDYVHGLRFPMSQPSKESEKQKDLMTEIKTTRKVVRSRPSMPPQSIGSTSSLGPSQKKLPPQMVIKPTLLGLDQRKGTHKINHMGPHNKILPHQVLDELVGPSSSSDSYFSTINKQGSSASSSENFGYSLPSQTRTYHQIGPTSETSWASEKNQGSGSSIESYGYSLPSQTQAHHNIGPTSESSWASNESYDYIGPTSRRIVITSESSSEDIKSGPYAGLTRRFKSGRRRSPKKSIGRLRKFKNKLGLIFHHHHHHHHHHHDDDENGQKMLHHRDVHVRAIQKVKKSAVTSLPRKHQVGHFHGLMEGLLKHVQHSKKSKGSKGGITRLGNGPRGGKKKLHLWKMLRHRRGGVKLPKSKRGVLET
ncbi:uncharacterized protein LOC111992477 [Quercus suber]|uniref:uncharacterized protein LOC111992477 n=1 Tax=Quercus suber TaxID=58331 RepID=UPI0032DF53B3